MNKRNLNLEKYGISGKRYKELCGFCEQYPEWKAIVDLDHNTVKSAGITDMPVAHGNSDQTMNLALKREDVKKKCDLIEQTAKQASGEFWKYIIKAVCYEIPIKWIIVYEELPISQASFYDLRRHFFFLLNQNKK